MNTVIFKDWVNLEDYSGRDQLATYYSFFLPDQAIEANLQQDGQWCLSMASVNREGN